MPPGPKVARSKTTSKLAPALSPEGAALTEWGAVQSEVQRHGQLHWLDAANRPGKSKVNR